MHGVFLDIDSLNPGDLDLRPLRNCLPSWDIYPGTSPAQIIERIHQADIIVSNKTPISASTLVSTPTLRLICIAATGTNIIDAEVAHKHDVTISNARRYATASVVEHVFSVLLTLTRRLDRYRLRVENGDWSTSSQFCVFDETIGELAGKTLGIIGYGQLGQAVAKIAEAFSMTVQVAQRTHAPPISGRVSLDALLESSDIISIHCPLTDQTRGLIGASQLQQMKNQAILINSARGGIVDEPALLTALQERQIAAAAVDVLHTEPPEALHSLLQYKADNLIVTPHIAWASQAARQRLLEEIVKNIQAFQNGVPRNLIQPCPAKD